MLDALWASSHSPTGKARGTLPFGLLEKGIIMFEEKTNVLIIGAVLRKNVQALRPLLSGRCDHTNSDIRFLDILNNAGGKKDIWRN